MSNFSKFTGSVSLPEMDQKSNTLHLIQQGRTKKAMMLKQKVSLMENSFSKRKQKEKISIYQLCIYFLFIQNLSKCFKKFVYVIKSSLAIKDDLLIPLMQVHPRSKIIQ